MPRFANGQIPYGFLVKFGEGTSGGEHYEWWTSPASLARLNQLVKLGQQKYGVTLRVTPGWNAYRPLDVQKRYRAQLGIYAAVPGYSSHGGSINGSDCLAFDIGNWGELAPGNAILAWSRFVALCKAVGFTVDFVKPREQWHVGDFHPWSMPAFASVVIKPGTTNHPTVEDDMYTDADRARDQKAAVRTDAIYGALFGGRQLTDVAGQKVEWIGADGLKHSTIYGLLDIEIETQRMIAAAQPKQ